MPCDPVCGRTTDPSRAPLRAVYRGYAYYFCSPACKDAFDRDPNRHAQAGAECEPREATPPPRRHYQSG
ncbi:MAG: YHS domain-containing protein [Bacillota bacterium]